MGEHSKSSHILKGIDTFFLCVIGLIYRVVISIAHFFKWLWGKSHIALIVIIVVAVLIVGGLVDLASYSGKIYAGVSIGNVDVSHMDRNEAIEAVSAEYDADLDDTQVIIFANEDAENSADLDKQLLQYEALAEQMSFDEAQENKLIWMEDASSLGAKLPIDDLVDKAFEIGRSDGGFFGRLSTLFSGRNINVEITFNDDLIDDLAQNIDSTIGEPRINYSITVKDGTASVVDGSDGYEVNRQWLATQLSKALLTSMQSGDTQPGTFVAQVEYAPLQIDEQSAQNTCDAVNTLISQGVTFIYNDTSLYVSRKDLGNWVSTRVEKNADDVYVLQPYLDLDIATPALLNLVNEKAGDGDISFEFSVEGDTVSVVLDREVEVPLAQEALKSFDEDIFGDYRNGESNVEAKDFVFEVEIGKVSGTLSFDEAYDYGIISSISSFTTEFVNTESTANRTHNIHLAASLLNNSVAKANGGRWSFNEIAGNCDEDAGFLSAGAIAGGEYIEDAGGGICQVATTVFNAVFEAGYKVIERSNHSLYVSSYPAGRDAAIAYPDMDLIWENDTSTDVLLTTSNDDTSITVTLYGVDPHYSVTSETGDWIEGESYSTETVVDDTLEPGTSYIETAGSDGLEITVNRTVKDRNGDILYEDVFNSIYSPVNEVIVEGS